MIRLCEDKDFQAILETVNDGARAYKGIIPTDRWSEPYMPGEKLQQEIEEGVVFWTLDEGGTLAGVMGIQSVRDVVLIRHAYVRTSRQGQGIGSKLLRHLLASAERPVLIGAWAAATWAIRFYEAHGFQVVSLEEKERLLRTYWHIPERQVEASVVLADRRWQQTAVAR